MDPIIKKQSEASILAKQALKDLKCIADNAEAFGVTVNTVNVMHLVLNKIVFSLIL